MLVITRREGEGTLLRFDTVDGQREVLVKPVRIRGRAIRLGIEAPDEVRVIRVELAQQRPLAKFRRG